MRHVDLLSLVHTGVEVKGDKKLFVVVDFLSPELATATFCQLRFRLRRQCGRAISLLICRLSLVFLLVVLVLVVLVGATSSKKPKAPSFQIASG